MENQTTETFRELLIDLMKEKSLSVRKLGEISGIDHATISKIMNGKRKVNLTHMQKLSKSLDVELISLLDAAGYTTEKKGHEDDRLLESVEAIQKLIRVTNIDERDISLEKIKREIEEYKLASQTDKGRETILQQFQDKLKKHAMMGPYVEKLRTMYARFSKRKGSTKDLMLIGAGLLYFVITTDLIPDYLFAVGLLDDALIIQTISEHMESKN